MTASHTDSYYSSTVRIKNILFYSILLYWCKFVLSIINDHLRYQNRPYQKHFILYKWTPGCFHQRITQYQITTVTWFGIWYLFLFVVQSQGRRKHLLNFSPNCAFFKLRKPWVQRTTLSLWGWGRQVFFCKRRWLRAISVIFNLIFITQNQVVSSLNWGYSTLLFFLNLCVCIL